jgi:hypothetical protein
LDDGLLYCLTKLDIWNKAEYSELMDREEHANGATGMINKYLAIHKYRRAERRARSACKYP